MLTPKETTGLLSQVTEVLNQLEIEYIIAGGVAISAYTKPRATKDIDIVIKKDLEAKTLKQLKTILRRMGWKYEGINDEFTHKRYLFSKSVLGKSTRNYMELWINGISYTRRFDTDTWKRKKKRKIQEVTLILPCVEDLLASKTALERDSIDMIYHAKSQAVDDICNILNKYGEDMNYTYLKRRLKRWNLLELFLIEIEIMRDRKLCKLDVGKIKKEMGF